MADVVNFNPDLLSIMERLNIRLGFGDMTIAELCDRYGLPVNLFLMVCSIYTFENYVPQIDELGSDDIPYIIAYLRTSHRYYTKKSFPRLHKNIHLMVRSCDEINSKVLNKFYDDYDSEVNHHFEYEEKIVFPYIEDLIKLKHGDFESYNIDKFEENHSNIDEKLNDLKNIVLKYLPENGSNAVRYEVINEILAIEKDLKRHSSVENKLLIPLVSKLERNG